MPEKVSSVLKTLSLCNCHNFIFPLSFCGILAFTLSCLSLTLNSSPNSSFKPVPIALQSQSLNKFLMVSLVSWLSYFLLCYLIRCVYLMFFCCSLFKSIYSFFRELNFPSKSSFGLLKSITKFTNINLELYLEVLCIHYSSFFPTKKVINTIISYP